MSRYIDADKARRELITLGDLIGAKYIDNIPSADVVERRRGEWILTPYTDSGSPIHECSVCTHGVSGDLKVRNFCPNCGADMRKE